MLTENPYYVYRHIRPDKDVPFYVGIGKQSKTYNRSLDRRRNPLWKNVVAKLGGTFQAEVMVADLTLDQALVKEQEFISLYGKVIDGTGTLTNVLDGGSGSATNYMSVEQRENLRQLMTGNQYAKGYKFSPDACQQMSITRKGRQNNLGKTWSDETRQKMSEGHKGNTATKGYRHITDGVTNTSIKADAQIPQGFRYGRTFAKSKLITNP